MLKRFFCLLLAAYFIIQAGGLMLYYSVQQYVIKFETELTLVPDDRLETLTLSVDIYKQCLVEEDEIKYEGKLYDIKTMLKSGSLLHLTVLHDAKEESILSEIEEFFTDNEKARKILPGLLGFLTPVYFITENIKPVFHTCCQYFTLPATGIVFSGYLDILLLPPEC